MVRWAKVHPASNQSKSNLLLFMVVTLDTSHDDRSPLKLVLEFSFPANPANTDTRMQPWRIRISDDDQMAAI
jgi:hypothetical protein